ncbi:MAG: hypothetical protein ACM34K_16740 [Bacillota bacterium]
MELFWLIIAWVISLYIIRLHLELHAYRKYLNQHNDIYVPSYQELSQGNSWNLKPVYSFLLQVKKETKHSAQKITPIYRKKLIPSSVFIKE